MRGTVLKVRHLTDDTYQVVEFFLGEYGEYEDERSLYQGSLSNCEAYIRLKDSDLIV